MQWGNLENFLHMGGYAGYVWGAYGVTVVVLVAEILSRRARRRRALQEVTRYASASKGSAS
mgnify:CR=1 FL=1